MTRELSVNNRICILEKLTSLDCNSYKVQMFKSSKDLKCFSGICFIGNIYFLIFEFVGAVIFHFWF